MDGKQNIKLDLSLDQVNFILEKLCKLPFEDVNILIGEIVKQANVQIKPVEK